MVELYYLTFIRCFKKPGRSENGEYNKMNI